ncbi:MAG TPA: crossover junction endodeoxyribonuclease RuvC [Candidatus Alistipes merdigallinarum]|nr:crossover junction endodeoxyribonuclease RuvC [Candidatus Alistipes merdigallinarum]
MGIDPGTNVTGYGLLRVEEHTAMCLVLGDIDLHRITDPYQKLRYIFERVSGLIDEYHPDEVALESPFFGKNIQSMLKLGRAQGVAMAAALSRGVSVAEYAPRKVKQTITGRGSASKEQVALMLKNLLHLDALPRRLDATDGLAVAVCHWFQSAPVPKLESRTKKKALGGGPVASCSWEQFVSNHPERVKK